MKQFIHLVFPSSVEQPAHFTRELFARFSPGKQFFLQFLHVRFVGVEWPLFHSSSLCINLP